MGDIRPGRLAPAHLAGGIGLLVVSGAAIAAGPANGTRLGAASLTAWIVALGYAAAAAAFAGRRLSGQARLGWLGIAGATAAQLLGTADAVPGGHGLAELSNLRLLAVPLGAGAALALLVSYVGAGRVRAALDAAIATTSVAMVGWFLMLRDRTAGNDASTLLPLAVLVACSALLCQLIAGADRRDRPALIALLAAVGTAAMWSLITATGPVMGSSVADRIALGLPVLVGVLLAWSVTLAAAPRPGIATTSLTLIVSGLPYAAVILFAAVIAAAAVSGGTDVGLLLAGALLMLLISVRQYLALRENGDLARRLQRSGERLAHSEEHFRELVQNSSDMIAVLDADGRVQWLSPSMLALLGPDGNALVGGDLARLVHPDDGNALTGEFEVASQRPGHGLPVVLRVCDRNGSWRTVEAVSTNMLDIAAVAGVVLNIRDVTERHELLDQLAHKTFHDSLTGLPNRALLDDRVGQALARTARSGDHIALLVLDIDDFQTVTDSLGGSVGDQLLCSVAQRLSGTLRDGDTAAALGLDMFGVLLESDGTQETALGVAARILDSIDRPFSIEGHRINIRATAGIALGDHSLAAADLMRRAVLALHRGKAAGKAQAQCFDEAMEVAARHRHQLHQELREALENHELRVHYQPVFRVSDQTVVGVEALVRWQHPVRGLIAPGEFIPAAEETGLVIPLTRQVLRESCIQARRWHLDHADRPPISMSVNISAVHLQRADFVDDVLEALRESQLDPETLILELTESAVMADLQGSIQRLRAVKELGIRIALDDFGTGYSTFGSLHDVPADILKIDRSFVIDVAAAGDRQEIVRTIQSLGTNLRLETVAEGVEAEDQMAELRAIGVDHAQGFLLARPESAELVSRRLDDWLTPHASRQDRRSGHRQAH